jgi:cytidylate kinase
MHDAKFVVAIDGPSGVGKSTVARQLAHRLNLPYLDTGAMYRAIALAILDRAIDPHDPATVEKVADDIEITLVRQLDGRFEVLLEGRSVGDRIRTSQIGDIASTISAYSGVRRRLVAIQQAAAAEHGGVLEGRDIGTRVFPSTPYKFFLDARPEIRYARRHAELTAAGREVTYADVVDELTRRDARDRTRTDSPLTCDSSYLQVDSSDLEIEAVVDLLIHSIRFPTSPGPSEISGESGQSPP